MLIVIRDTLRAKEPIAMEMKQTILQIANVMNLFQNRPLHFHVAEYLKVENRKIPSAMKNPIDLLQPEVKENEQFVNKLKKELQMATSVLKLIKLRNQLEKVKYEAKYLNFINGTKRIIQMSHRFEALSSLIEGANEALMDLKIEVISI